MAKKPDSFFPKWAGPEWLYELMCAYRDAYQAATKKHPKATPAQINALVKIDKRDVDEFANQLFSVVKIVVVQYHLDIRMRQVRCDQESVCQEAVLHLMKQSKRGLGLRHEGWRPMMTVMNLAVKRFIISAIQTAKPKHEREAASADYYGSARDSGKADQDTAISHDDHADKSGNIVRRIFDENEDLVIGDLVGNASKTNLIDKTYRIIESQIVESQCPLGYKDLPDEVKEGITHEEHWRIISRVLRTFRQG